MKTKTACFAFTGLLGPAVCATRRYRERPKATSFTLDNNGWRIWRWFGAGDPIVNAGNDRVRTDFDIFVPQTHKNPLNQI